MPSLLYQTIEGLSREKGIDPQIVVSAVEDAIVVATRKSLKTEENLRAELDKESGAIHVYAVKSVVETPEQVEDANLQIALEEARKTDANVEVGGEVEIKDVLMVADGADIKVGTPLLAGASVKATVLAHGRHDKVMIFKMRRRKHYRKTQGHRQNYTEIRIDGIAVA